MSGTRASAKWVGMAALLAMFFGGCSDDMTSESTVETSAPVARQPNEICSELTEVSARFNAWVKAQEEGPVAFDDQTPAQVHEWSLFWIENVVRMEELTLELDQFARTTSVLPRIIEQAGLAVAHSSEQLAAIRAETPNLLRARTPADLDAIMLRIPPFRMSDVNIDSLTAWIRRADPACAAFFDANGI